MYKKWNNILGSFKDQKKSICTKVKLLKYLEEIKYCISIKMKNFLTGLSLYIQYFQMKFNKTI